jgi:hypothetical protein
MPIFYLQWLCLYVPAGMDAVAARCRMPLSIAILATEARCKRTTPKVFLTCCALAAACTIHSQFQTRLIWASHTHSRLPNQQQQQQQFQVVQPPHQQQHQQQLSSASNGNGSSNGSNGSNAAASAAPQQQSQLHAGWDKLKSVSWPAGNGNGNGNGSSNGKSSSNSTPGSITGAALVQVWCEVVPPFQLMPREVLERSCNVVITGLVNSLLPWFMRQLAADYAKWAADPAYRAERRLRTSQKVVHSS